MNKNMVSIVDAGTGWTMFWRGDYVRVLRRIFILIEGPLKASLSDDDAGNDDIERLFLRDQRKQATEILDID